MSNEREPLPIGSYQRSSRNERVERDDNGTYWLIAECARCDGSWVESRLQLKEIHNTDGRLEYGLDMNIRKAWNDAVENCHETEVAVLLRAKPELAQTGVIRYRSNGTFYELPPVHVAGKKSLPIVKQLVEAGADCSPGLPMYHACAEVTEYLLSRGADVNAGDLLSNAAYMGEVHNVEIYLKHGARLDLPPHISPLHCACFYSPRLQGFETDEGFDPKPFREIVRLLLNADAEVNARCGDNVPCDAGPISIHAETPLHFAAAGGDIEIVRMLLDAGAEANATNTLGENPSDWSKKYYGNADIERLLDDNRRT